MEDLNEPLLPAAAPRISRNVRLTLVYTALAFAGRSLWSQSVLATLVFLWRDNAESVGYVTAVMGVAQLITSFPAGYVADTFRRDRLLQVAACLGTGAILATLDACYRLSFRSLVLALAVWGCTWGVENTSLMALFADSVPQGKRAHYFTQRSILITLGNTCGPLVALAMFAKLGDEWTIQDCAIVMAVGQLICFPAIVCLCFFDDQDVPHGPSDSLLNDPQEEAALLIENEDDEDETPQCVPEHRRIPVLVATADMISGLGSGMSIRYFPIFFVTYLHLSPVLVQVLYVAAPLGQALLMKAAQQLAPYYGRSRVSVCFKWTGIVCMLAMLAAYTAGWPTWTVCLIYVLRTALMNSTSALTRSLLMDHVPKHERGKWSALESVNMFSWSGSAFLGGVLIAWIGIFPLFVVTASVQFCATLPLICLFGRDYESRNDEDDSFHSTEEGDPEAHDVEENASREEGDSEACDEEESAT